MSDYPMLISNKLHSFRNFAGQRYDFCPNPETGPHGDREKNNSKEIRNSQLFCNFAVQKDLQALKIIYSNYYNYADCRDSRKGDPRLARQSDR